MTKIIRFLDLDESLRSSLKQYDRDAHKVSITDFDTVRKQYKVNGVYHNKQKLFEEAKKAFHSLTESYAPIVMEGAGSISELNLNNYLFFIKNIRNKPKQKNM